MEWLWEDWPRTLATVALVGVLMWLDSRFPRVSGLLRSTLVVTSLGLGVALLVTRGRWLAETPTDAYVGGGLLVALGLLLVPCAVAPFVREWAEREESEPVASSSP